MSHHYGESAGFGEEPKPHGLAPMRPGMNRGAKVRPQEPIINAAVVRERRVHLGMTQVQLAIAAATNPTTIRKIERGRNLDPPTSVTLRLAKALSTSVEALCRGARPYSSRNISRVGTRIQYPTDYTPEDPEAS